MEGRAQYTLGGSRIYYPKCATWHVDCSELKAVKTQRLRRSFVVLPGQPKINLDGEPVPEKGPWPKTTFCIRKTYLHGRANICLPIVCSSHLSANCLPPPLKPQDPIPFLFSSGWHISLKCLTAFELLMSLWGSCTHKIKFVFLLLICPMSI